VRWYINAISKVNSIEYLYVYMFKYCKQNDFKICPQCLYVLISMA